MPRRSRKDAGASNIVERSSDQVKIREGVAHQGMLQYGELGNDEGNLAQAKFFDKMVAMGVLAVEHREIFPATSGGVEALQLVGDPGGFALGGVQFDDANLFALRFVGLQDFFWKFR